MTASVSRGNQNPDLPSLTTITTNTANFLSIGIVCLIKPMMSDQPLVLQLAIGATVGVATWGVTNKIVTEIANRWIKPHSA